MRIQSFTAAIAALLLAPASLRCQDTLHGPNLGYVWDPAVATLRMIRGIPGAATVGPALDLGVTLNYAEVSRQHDYALAVIASQQIVTIDLRTAERTLRPLDATAPDRFELSPTGSSAALYYRQSSSVQVLTGLPASPSVADEFQFSGLNSPVSAIAINDSGDTLLVATSGGLYAITTEQRTPSLVSAGGQISAVSFLENSRDALVADYGRNEVILVRGLPNAVERRVLANERDGLLPPIAIAAYDSNRRVVAAGANTLMMLRIEGGPTTSLPCPCKISSLGRLKADAVFWLNAPSRDPMFLLDAEAAEPRVLFVPGAPGGGMASSPASATVQIPRRRAR